MSGCWSVCDDNKSHRTSEGRYGHVHGGGGHPLVGGVSHERVVGCEGGVQSHYPR